MAERQIFKYEVPFGEGVVEMPKGAQLLHVGCQLKSPQGGEAVYVWALVDPAADNELRPLGYFATGQEIPQGAEYVGTAINSDGAFVWHVFDGGGES